MKNFIKRLLPSAALSRIHSYKLARLRKEYASLSVVDAFSKIYRENLWGGDKNEFFSGSGSIGRVADTYIDYISKFIITHDIKSVVDLGCGDFRIGRNIAAVSRHYIGVDVVPELISHHNEKYSCDTIDFQCLDITRDAIPSGELCLVRQVLQHLSNAEVASVLNKLNGFRYILITEHFPPMNESFVANMDKPHGPDTRLVDNSALMLSASPFSLKNIEQVLSVDVDEHATTGGDTIRTFLHHGSVT